MTAFERPVAAIGTTRAQQQGELLAGRVLSARGSGLYAYAYRLTLSDTAATAALRYAAVTLRSGSPRILDEQTALEAARAEIGRRSIELAVAPLAPSLHEADLVRTGFHRRLHGLPTLERQCWLLRHTGGHDLEAIADLLLISPERVRAALASAASTLVEGELAEADGAE